MSGWRSMDTAPKDGSEVLMVVRLHGERVLGTLKWDARRYAKDGWRDDADIPYEMPPICWMPFPEIPSEEEFGHPEFVDLVPV